MKALKPQPRCLLRGYANSFLLGLVPVPLTLLESIAVSAVADGDLL